MDVIYLDYNASSPLAQELLKELPSLTRQCEGNPSSLHQQGRRSRRLIREATETVARHARCMPEEIFWTSGASEANSWIFHSLAKALGRKPRVLLSALEHDSTLLGASDCDLQKFRLLPDGTADLDDLAAKLATEAIDLVCLVHAHNETGVIQPVTQAAQLCARANVPLHVDCAQTFGRVQVDLNTLGATYVTLSAHKFGGPKGVGALIAKSSGPSLFPLVAGKQQRGLRGGTENVLGAVLTAQALELAAKTYPDSGLADLRDDFERELTRLVPDTVVHGAKAPRLPNTSFFGFEGLDASGLLMSLDLAGICVSSGSACSSGVLGPSRVLLAMGHGEQIARNSLRLSSGPATTKAEYTRVLELLPDLMLRHTASLKAKQMRQ